MVFLLKNIYKSQKNTYLLLNIINLIKKNNIMGCGCKKRKPKPKPKTSSSSSSTTSKPSSSGGK